MMRGAVRSLADIDWEDYTECTPAVICALAMPLSFSIADGIGLGFVTYATIKVLAGKPGECNTVDEALGREIIEFIGNGR